MATQSDGTKPSRIEWRAKGVAWLLIAAGLVIRFVVVPLMTAHVTIPFSAFVTRYIPIWLAPTNWALLLVLVAVCEGPLLKPKYVSGVMYVLLLASALFLMGSWTFHPVLSPVICGLAYVEMYWLIPWWELKLSQAQS